MGLTHFSGQPQVVIIGTAVFGTSHLSPASSFRHTALSLFVSRREKQVTTSFPGTVGVGVLTENLFTLVHR